MYIEKIYFNFRKIGVYFLIILNGSCVNYSGSRQIGSLPRPGLFTLYELADTSNLLYKYHETIKSLESKPFPLRGIIYTKHGGFIDLAHVYNTATLSNYIAKLLINSAKEGQGIVSLENIDDTDVKIYLSVNLKEIKTENSTYHIDIERDIRKFSECAAFELMTWHEIITWFGYQTTWLWTEKPSAFTYEDIVSNLLGIQVFDIVSGDMNTSSYGTALRVTLHDLGLVSADLASVAINSVEGRWWRPDLYTKRLVDMGDYEGLITPWLVPDITAENPQHTTEVHKFALPCNNVSRDYSLWLTPSTEILLLVRKTIRTLPDSFDAEAELPFLVKIVRIEIERELGKNELAEKIKATYNDYLNKRFGQSTSKPILIKSFL